MRIETNAENRKQMAQAVAEHLGETMQYAGAPSFAYLIGRFVVNRDGSITSEHDDGEDELRAFLVEAGYAEEIPAELNVTIPAEDLTALGIRNLIFMLASREYLLNKALGGQYFAVSSDLIKELTENPKEEKTDVLGQINDAGGLAGLTITETEVTFTFPMAEEPEGNKACTELAAAMFARAKEAKRIRPERHEVENEKYYFRAWIVSLGFGGADSKASRRFLLGNLKGHSAFKTDEDAEKFKAAMKEKRRAAKESEVQA